MARSRFVTPDAREALERRPAARPARPARAPGRGRRVSASIVIRVRWRSSASEPVSTVRPARMIVTRSHSASTSDEDVAGEQHGAARARARSATHARKTSSISGSRPEVGSSRISSSTSDAKRGDQRDLLPVALGVRAALLRRVELEALQQLLAAPLVQAAAQPAEQVDRLAAAEVGPQRHVARHVGEPPVQRGRVAPRVAAQQRHRARVVPAAARAARGSSSTCPRRSGRGSRAPRPRRRRGRARRARATSRTS